MSVLEALESNASPERQRGIVLVLALVFLLLSTLLATGAVGQALLQQRMAGAQRHAQLADMAAESALHGAQWRLWRGAALGEPGWVLEGAAEYRGHDGRHDFTTLAEAGLDEDSRKSAVLAKQPVYLIEDLGPASASSTAHTGRHIYRITARATGGHAQIARVVQSMFAVGTD